MGKNLSDSIDNSMFLLEAFWYKLEEDLPFQIRYTVADKGKTKTKKETLFDRNIEIRVSLYFMKNIFYFLVCIYIYIKEKRDVGQQ
jgi:uncharacterized PurR-regulated membrane protein YhhQ (DUF165 family)